MNSTNFRNQDRITWKRADGMVAAVVLEVRDQMTKQRLCVRVIGSCHVNKKGEFVINGSAWAGTQWIDADNSVALAPVAGRA